MQADACLLQARLCWHMLPALYCHADWLPQWPVGAHNRVRCTQPRLLRAASLVLIQRHALAGPHDTALGDGVSRAVLLDVPAFEQLLRMAGLAVLQAQVVRQLDAVFHKALAAALAPASASALMADFSRRALPLDCARANHLHPGNIASRLMQAGAGLMMAMAAYWQPGTAARLRLRLPHQLDMPVVMTEPALGAILGCCMAHMTRPVWIGDASDKDAGDA